MIIILATGYISCKKVYAPQLSSVSTNFLAVDGPIISGDSTFIRLSRTTSLTDTTQNKAELKATVAVESDQNTLYPLIEKGKGLYVLGIANFDTNRKYRLDIKTSNGKIYQSDFVPMKTTPPIDSMYFKQTQADEITFYVDSHDPGNNTRYYRWDYKDTWAYVPIYHTNYLYKNGIISAVVKDSPDDINICYSTANSNQIIIGSTAKLAQDEMKQQPLFSITSASEKIAHVYTIQVRQYALTKEAFEYYQNLKTNTEQLGSIFDPQASTLKGNIHCVTNPAELVIGFINASTVANLQYNLLEKNDPLNPPQINLGTTGINSYAYPKPYFEQCVVSAGSNGTVSTGSAWSFAFPNVPDLNKQSPQFYVRANRALASGDSLLFDIQSIYPLLAYLYAPKACVDCRLRGGTNIRPTYFPPVR
ncbi:MAG: DUF4249 domain-containing protein [Mucilaginibacter sp.]